MGAYYLFFTWAHQDSNLGLPDYESGALTAELWAPRTIDLAKVTLNQQSAFWGTILAFFGGMCNNITYYGQAHPFM